MSQSSSNLGGIVAGVVTALVESASPGLVGKAQTVAQHSFSAFTSHNPGLISVGESLLNFAEQQAQTHGFGVVNDIFNGLIGILAAAPSGVTVSVPGAASSSPGAPATVPAATAS